MHNTFVNRECNTVDIVSVGIVSIEDSEEDSGASNEGGTEVIAEFEEAEADAPRVLLLRMGKRRGLPQVFAADPLFDEAMVPVLWCQAAGGSRQVVYKCRTRAKTLLKSIVHMPFDIATGTSSSKV